MIKYYLLLVIAAIVLAVFIFHERIIVVPVNTFFLKSDQRQSNVKKISNIERSFVYTLEKEYSDTFNKSKDVIKSDLVYVTNVNHKNGFLEAKSADKNLEFVITASTVVAYPKFNYSESGELVGILDESTNTSKSFDIKKGDILLVSYFKSKTTSGIPVPLLHVSIFENW